MHSSALTSLTRPVVPLTQNAVIAAEFDRQRLARYEDSLQSMRQDVERAGQRQTELTRLLTGVFFISPCFKNTQLRHVLHACALFFHAARSRL